MNELLKKIRELSTYNLFDPSDTPTGDIYGVIEYNSLASYEDVQILFTIDIIGTSSSVCVAACETLKDSLSGVKYKGSNVTFNIWRNPTINVKPLSNQKLICRSITFTIDMYYN